MVNDYADNCVIEKMPFRPRYNYPLMLKQMPSLKTEAVMPTEARVDESLDKAGRNASALVSLALG